MDQPDAPHAARVAAANSLLDRGWGKPTQPIAGDDEADALRLEVIKRVIIDPTGNQDSAGVRAAAVSSEI